MAPTQDALYAELDLALSWSESRPAAARADEARPRAAPLPRQVHPAARRGAAGALRAARADTFSTRSPARARRSSRRSRAAVTRPAPTSPPSTSSSAASRRRSTTRSRSKATCATSLRRLPDAPSAPATPFLRRWYAPQSARELLAFRGLIEGSEHADVLHVILARAARSARLTTHFDLDFPRAPQHGPYWCHKHKRECRPVERAAHFLTRYGLDTVARIKAFARLRERGRAATVLHGGRARARLRPPLRRGRDLAAVPGPDRLPRAAPLRLRAARAPRPGRARARPRLVEGGARRVRGRDRRGARATPARTCGPGAAVCVVVADRRDLFPEILARAGLRLEQRLRRHVNRRTGRRAGRVLRGRARRPGLDVLPRTLWTRLIGGRPPSELCGLRSL